MGKAFFVAAAVLVATAIAGTPNIPTDTAHIVTVADQPGDMHWTPQAAR